MTPDVPTSPAQDATLAYAALSSGNLQHALQHAMSAVTADLQNPAWTAILDRVLDASEDPLSFTAFGEDPWHGQVAAHARALHRLGHHAAALSLLIQIAQHLPLEGWLHWGNIRATDQAEHLWYPLLAYREAHQSTPAHMAPVLPLLDRLPRAPRLRWIRSLVLRSLGQYEEALAASEAAFSADPVREYLISSACSLRALDRTDEAVAAYRRAQHMKADELSPSLDIGDTLFDAGRYREALSAYRYFEAAHPDHAWATPSALFCQWQVSGETADFHTLARWLQAHPDSRRAQHLLGLVQASPAEEIVAPPAADPAALWRTVLPSPVDASINAIRNLAAQEKNLQPGAQLQLSASGLESPSVLLAWEELCRRRGWTAALELRCDVQQDPDPRLPIPEVGVALWTWEGNQPVAQFSPEFPDLGELVAQVARTPFDADAWAAAFQQMRRSGLELSDAQTGDLACWMLEPPPGPADIDPWDWVLRFQTACALGMAAQGGWQGSVRRAALTKILLGVMDWPVAAAAVALSWIARQEPELSEEIQHWFALRFQNRPSRGYCCYQDAVLRCWLVMPGVPVDIEGQIRGMLK